MKRTILLFMVLVALFIAVPGYAQTTGGNWLMDRGSFTLAYAHSFDSAKDGLIAKASVDVAEVKLPLLGRSLTFSADLCTVPDLSDVKIGFGGSATLKDAILGINIGVAYLPDGYGWSWNATMIKLEF